MSGVETLHTAHLSPAAYGTGGVGTTDPLDLAGVLTCDRREGDGW